MFCLSRLVFSCVYSFFQEIMKFYKDICSAWISRTSVKLFFSQIDVICVIKYNRNTFDLLKCSSVDFFKLQCAKANDGTEMSLVKFSPETLPSLYNFCNTITKSTTPSPSKCYVTFRWSLTVSPISDGVSVISLIVSPVSPVSYFRFFNKCLLF